MRILIATGVFEPESGGPATYAPQLATRLVAAGHEVTVITYSTEQSYPSDSNYTFKLVRVVRGNPILNRFNFFKAVKEHAASCDLIYTLDWFAAGLPVCIAAQLLHKPYVIRIGGDYLWEKYLASNLSPISLADFYTSGIHKKPQHLIFFLLIRMVLSKAAHVVFNSDIQRQLYITQYGLEDSKTSVIYNPVPVIEKSEIETLETPPTEFISWGRLIRAKNFDTLIKAFDVAQLSPEYTLTIIGDGPEKLRLLMLIKDLKLENRVNMFPSMSQKDVLVRAKKARAFVLPSWTDISPNQVCEGLALGVPGIITSENYLKFRDQLPLVINPRLINDVADKLKQCADTAQYEEIKKKWTAITFTQTWDDVTREHIVLFESLQQKV